MCVCVCTYIRTYLCSLQFVKEEITARVPSVESVNEAAGKLVSSSSSGDAPDLKNDIEELNRKWVCLC